MAKEILLTQGRVAVVDDQDYGWLSVHKWSAVRVELKSGFVQWYAARGPMDGEYGVKTMHRQILGFPVNVKTDHKDGNGLNNQRWNLRVATVQQNGRNRKHLGPGKTSRFKGVNWHARDKRWQAKIRGSERGIDGIYLSIFLGYYDSEEEAARAYDAAALEFHGEFAATNEEAGRFLPKPPERPTSEGAGLPKKSQR